jgi:N-acetylmuramoyl-L-alanine amidase
MKRRSGISLIALTISMAAPLLAPHSSSALISVAELNARKARQIHKASPSPSPSITSVAAPVAAAAPEPAPSPHPFLVVLDPGHGGIDNGASFSRGHDAVFEKNVTLMLAHQVAAQLRNRGIDVILTRDMDHEMPLAARTALANKMGADVFISLHMNSLPNKNEQLASGTETFILNNANDDSSKRLAQLENMLMAGEHEPQGVAQTGDVALILKDLRLDANLPESKRLACMIQHQLVVAHSKAEGKVIPAKTDRGVRQALFFVLLGADMPSALVEAGFLSNSKDRTWITSAAGQKSLGVAIARAINLFRIQKNTSEARKTLNTCKVH